MLNKYVNWGLTTEKQMPCIVILTTIDILDSSINSVENICFLAFVLIIMYASILK